MPVTPYAKVLVSVSGGPNTSGGLTVLNGDTIQLSGENTVGWTSQTWEIYGFYSTSDFPLPAGWTNAGNNVYRSTAVTPPVFTLPAGPAWGKFLLRLTVNGGLLEGAVAPSLKDESSALSILSSSGFEDMAYLESNQFSAVQKWAAGVRATLRTIDTLIGGVAAPATPLATPNTLALRGASADCAFGDLTATALRAPSPNGSGAGDPLPITSQSAKSGSAADGGSVVVTTGVAGDASHHGGDLSIKLGAEASDNKSAATVWYSGAGAGSEFARLYSLSTGAILSGANALALACGSRVLTITSSDFDFDGVVHLSDQAAAGTPSSGVTIQSSGGSLLLNQKTTPSVIGPKGGNAALGSLLTQLAALGIIVDNTT